MAIGTTPLFSKISGSAGPVDFRTRRNGKIEIGKKRIPANPQSTRQLEVRNGYGRLHELWQNASYIDKAQYERLGQLYNVSPWNAFLMRHQPAMSAAPVVSMGMVENSGLSLHDLTANNNHSTISGASWGLLSPANLSYLDFDGIDDNVTTTLITNFVSGDSTVMTWVYIKDQISPAYDTGTVFGLNPPYGYNTSINTVTDTLNIYKWAGATCQNTILTNYKYVWILLSIVYTQSDFRTKLYINAVLKNNTAGFAPTYTSGSIMLGDMNDGTDRKFTGNMATFDTYFTPFTGPEIQRYYNSTKHIFGVYP